MADTDQNTRLRLLESAKKEFLEYGYEKASLRKICADAGVTTGALYFFFSGKEELFEHVVQGAVLQLGRLSKEMIESELEDTSLGVENERRFLEFCWNNRKVMEILLDKSRGTAYENFLDDMRERLEETYAQFFHKYSDSTIDGDLIHILVKMKMQAYIELITGGYTLERTLELAEQIGLYADGGFERLMEKLNSGQDNRV